MPKKELDEDPRTPDEIAADEEVLKQFERGKFLRISGSVRNEAIKRMKAKRAAKKKQNG